MNRQVGPSIVLSVLIVCFFAVALYRHDPPRSTGARSRLTAADAIARSRSAPLSGPSRSSAVEAETVERVRPASSRREIEFGARPLSPEESIATSKPTSAISTRAATGGLRGAGHPANGQRAAVVHRPGSSFTVVEADETLEDVARRVYGSGALVDSLWRANRDALSRKDAPLTGGMVLRTPVIR